MGNFKVGDLVTPDPDMCDPETMLHDHIGEVFTVVRVDEDGDLTIDRPINGTKDWFIARYWKLAKNKIVLDIIKDLQ